MAVVMVSSSPLPDQNKQETPSSKENELPSEFNLQQNENTEKIIQTGEAKYDKDMTASAPAITKPHRLSKRFISPRYGHELKRNGITAFSRSGSRLEDNSGKANGRQDSAYKKEVLNLLLGLSKPKRHFGLLPAKEPRRKDLPPRLGEESAPRFARAFSLPDSDREKRLPSVRTTLEDLLRDIKGLRYHVQPIDKTGRRLWGQTFHIDTPININNVDVDFGIENDYSYPDFSYSGLSSDYSDMTYSAEADDDGYKDQSSWSTIKKEELEKFKRNLTKFISTLQGVSRM